jgi:hypothetical protein
MKKILAALMTAALIVTAFPTMAAHAATAPVPFGTTRTAVESGTIYEIGSEEELAHLAELANSGQKCTGATFVLAQDIIVTNDYDSTGPGKWTPIGIAPDHSANDNYSFNGTFYGQNHTITIDLQYGNNSGLFGMISSDAVVQDLNVAGSIVSGSNTGGIAGLNFGMIKNCTNSAAITDDTAVSGNENVGGITGLNSGKISFCCNAGNISGENRCGGISGKNSREKMGAVSNISYCYNTAAISGGSYIGGISGSSPGSDHRTTVNCYNTGNITGDDYVGGIQGYHGINIGSGTLDNTVYNCYNTGSVTGTGSNVGSLEGCMEGHVQNCYWLTGSAAKSVGNDGGPYGSPVQSDSFGSNYMLSSNASKSLVSALNSYFNMGTDITWAQDTGSPYLDGIIMTSSGNQYALPGKSASFTADVSGWSVTYRWQVSKDGGTSWEDLTGNGADTPVYTTPQLASGMNGWQYHCVVGYLPGSTPESKTTAAAALYQGSVPVFTSQPPGTAYAADGEKIALVGVAAGSSVPEYPGHTIYPAFTAAIPDAQYEWRVSSDGGKTYGSAGSSAVFTMASGCDGMLLYCVATNDVGSATSDIVTLKLSKAPVISAQPQNAAVKSGNAAGFTVSASGAPAPAYQWQVSTDNGANWANVADGTGNTSASYNTPAATTGMNGYKYRCVVINTAGSVNSDPATLTVAEQNFTIAASAEPGGKITPSGSITVAEGKEQAFAIAPDPGYQVADVKVDGASVGAVSSYTFPNVTAGHAITASFSALPPDTYAIAASAGTGGKITPSGSVTVSKGAEQTFAIAPDPGYKIADVKVDGASVGAVSSYTFPSVTAAHSIAASFKSTGTYTIGAGVNSSKYGKASGAGKYAGGATAKLTAVPASGYRFVKWMEGTKTLSPAPAVYTFTVTKARTLKAYFSKIGTTKLASVKASGKGGIKVTWKAVSGAKGYYIYRATSKSGKYGKIKTVDGALTFTNTGLKKGKAYYYKVKAYCAAGTKITTGAYSNVLSAKAK